MVLTVQKVCKINLQGKSISQSKTILRQQHQITELQQELQNSQYFFADKQFQLQKAQQELEEKTKEYDKQVLQLQQEIEKLLRKEKSITHINQQSTKCSSISYYSSEYQVHSEPNFPAVQDSYQQIYDDLYDAQDTIQQLRFLLKQTTLQLQSDKDLAEAKLVKSQESYRLVFDDRNKLRSELAQIREGHAVLQHDIAILRERFAEKDFLYTEVSKCYKAQREANNKLKIDNENLRSANCILEFQLKNSKTVRLEQEIDQLKEIIDRLSARNAHAINEKYKAEQLTKALIENENDKIQQGVIVKVIGPVTIDWIYLEGDEWKMLHGGGKQQQIYQSLTYLQEILQGEKIQQLITLNNGVMSNYGYLSQSNIQESHALISYEDLNEINQIFQDKSQSIDNDLSFADNEECPNAVSFEVSSFFEEENQKTAIQQLQKTITQQEQKIKLMKQETNDLQVNLQKTIKKNKQYKAKLKVDRLLHIRSIFTSFLEREPNTDQNREAVIQCIFQVLKFDSSEIARIQLKRASLAPKSSKLARFFFNR